MTTDKDAAALLQAIVDAIDQSGGVGPSHSNYSLYDYVDTEALAMLTRRADSEWQLQFGVEEYLVVVDSEGTVTVTSSSGKIRERR